MKWKRGERYNTSYGVAKIVKTNGKWALFRIEKVEPKAAQMGYRNGNTFKAHVDDETSPSPRTWQPVQNSPKRRNTELGLTPEQIARVNRKV